MATKRQKQRLVRKLIQNLASAHTEGDAALDDEREWILRVRAGRVLVSRPDGTDKFEVEIRAL